MTDVEKDLLVCVAGANLQTMTVCSWLLDAHDAAGLPEGAARSRDALYQSYKAVSDSLRQSLVRFQAGVHRDDDPQLMGALHAIGTAFDRQNQLLFHLAGGVVTAASICELVFAELRCRDSEDYRFYFPEAFDQKAFLAKAEHLLHNLREAAGRFVKRESEDPPAHM